MVDLSPNRDLADTGDVEWPRQRRPIGTRPHALRIFRQSPVLRCVRHRGRLAHSVARESEAILKPKGYALDWLAFADAWRDEYRPAMDEVSNGTCPFSKLDVLHRRNLERILPRFKVSGLDEPTMAASQPRLAPARRLAGCRARAAAAAQEVPDRAGLQRQHLADGVHGAAATAFPGMRSLAPEIAGEYKPQPRVYLRAAEAFDCAPHECVMVAAHSGDLAAAAATGLKTAHVARPNEKGPGKGEAAPTVPVDIAVSSFVELAEKLGA
jgi:2-haloacid dehalogenase